MKYKLHFNEIKKDVRNGIYTNFNDLASVLFRETVEYELLNYHSFISYEEWFKIMSKKLKEALNNTNNFIELNNYRITLLKD